MISNLLENARRYGKTAGHRRDQRGHCRQGRDKWVLLKLRDHGGRAARAGSPTSPKPFFRGCGPHGGGGAGRSVDCGQDRAAHGRHLCAGPTQYRRSGGAHSVATRQRKLPGGVDPKQRLHRPAVKARHLPRQRAQDRPEKRSETVSIKAHGSHPWAFFTIRALNTPVAIRNNRARHAETRRPGRGHHRPCFQRRGRCNQNCAGPAAQPYALCRWRSTSGGEGARLGRKSVAHQAVEHAGGVHHHPGNAVEHQRLRALGNVWAILRNFSSMAAPRAMKASSWG